MTTFFFLIKNVQKIQFIKRTNLIVVRIYSQATEAHWKKKEHFLLSVSERLYAKRKAMRHMCKKTVTQHLAKRDSRLPAYGSVVMQIFYFMKAFTMKNEFVMSHYFLFIIAQNIFNYCLLYS